MYQMQKRFAEAESLLTATLDSVVAARGLEAPDTKPLLAQLEALYEAWGKPAKSAKWQAKLTKSRNRSD